MRSRRTLLKTLFTCCSVVLAWLNFAPRAIALGGKFPPVNQPAPEFTPIGVEQAILIK